MNHLKRTFVAAGLAALALQSPARAAELHHLWTVEHFDAPESVIHDPARDRLIVSNIDGNPGEADGHGYLSLLSPDGSVLNRFWIDGLDAPKGMAINNDQLFVSDLERLHIIDLESGSLIDTLHAEEARFLNDVATGPNGEIYVSDMMAHRIFRYSNGQFESWLSHERISHPNGIHVSDDRLIVGNWGQGMHDDFTTSTPGSLMAVSLTDRAVSPVDGGNELGNIDGIAEIDGTLLVSDWVKGSLYAVSDSGDRVNLRQFESGIADIGAHGTMLYVPSMLSGSVQAYEVTTD